ncbi:plasma membrane G-protein coupled receptor [Venturia nashicola]|uniref:Plasma membrane G-protein coupled receptor n=1 Tax=Venturia nashicola TaxID=86259 RepID=A0A4Z1PE05_9PEZI|nr:plasma membrane G-protein coupled receptor [Venturia nashicola]TLD37814.1 plasma membrane G-protein coupled receptor [Venturia nashicola]
MWLQIIVTISSLITLLATVVTVYMFYRIPKRMRHMLIMLSLLGCFIRALWYFIAGVYDLSHHGVVSQGSHYCQTSGFFIRVGNGITDFATLFITIHAALQVFRPAVSTFDVDDGLHAYRLYVYLTIILVPIVLASIPFINGGYVSQAVFCALPRDPLWSRLVLAWFPRWIIIVIVIGLAIAVYAHVSKQLEEFSTNSRLSSKVSVRSDDVVGNLPTLGSVSLPFPKRKQKARDTLAGIDEEDERRRSSQMSSAIQVRMDPAQDQSTLPPVLSIPQYNQTPTTLPPITPGLVSPGALYESPGNSKCLDYFSLKTLAPILKAPQYNQGTALTPITPGLVSPITTGAVRETPVMSKDFAQTDYFNVKPAISQKDSPGSSSVPSNAVIPIQPWDRHGQLPHLMSDAPSSAYSTPNRQPNPQGGRAPGRRVSIVSIDDSSQILKEEKEERKEKGGNQRRKRRSGRKMSLPLPDQSIDVRRNALKKALRRGFVYPAIFVLFWIPPCAKNMLVFDTKRSENDPLWLAVLSNICITLMGAAYCLVFQWSERPWRQFVGRSLIWQILCKMLRPKKAKDLEEEGGGVIEFPPDGRPPSVKVASNNSTESHPSHGEVPIQAVSRQGPNVQAPDPAALGPRRPSIVGGASTISLAPSARSRAKSISFAPLGQHLAGGSTTSLSRQLALERLTLEQQDRRHETQFQRRLSLHSFGPSRMSSQASAVTSLGSISEAERKEWWDAEEDESEEESDVIVSKRWSCDLGIPGT